MIPSILGFQIKAKDRRDFRLWFPIFLFWPVLLALILITAPIVFFVSFILWHGGKGKIIFYAYIAIHSLMFCLSGFKIDIQAKDHTAFYMNLL